MERKSGLTFDERTFPIQNENSVALNVCHRMDCSVRNTCQVVGYLAAPEVVADVQVVVEENQSNLRPLSRKGERIR